MSSEKLSEFPQWPVTTSARGEHTRTFPVTSAPRTTGYFALSFKRHISCKLYGSNCMSRTKCNEQTTMSFEIICMSSTHEKE